MRAMPIQVRRGLSGWTQLKAAWNANQLYYFQEAIGLGIFMVSACFFGSMLFSPYSSWYAYLPDVFLRNILMGVAMGVTALVIFYSPITAPSGAHINPAVSLAFLRIGKTCRYDTLFFVLFQITGGTVAVFLMQLFLGKLLTSAPVHSVVTVPGKYGVAAAAVTEFSIAFITMMMVLFTSHHNTLKKYTRIFAACLVCVWVIAAGPVSGFGMNPARSFASALPAQIWTAFWIYLLMPFAGMMAAAEFFLKTKFAKQVTVKNGI
ncbi:aquaporin [Lacibacter sp. MH-610]|uniref:MIP/aquaporin family protein n=1 Tax=Lacibacter sp. MH-610 TaxID=3020883 RepID=UPI0038915BD2